MAAKSAPIRLSGTASRRTILQALLALPTFALFQTGTARPPAPTAGGIVEINGWILKRSDVA